MSSPGSCTTTIGARVEDNSGFACPGVGHILCQDKNRVQRPNLVLEIRLLWLSHRLNLWTNWHTRTGPTWMMIHVIHKNCVASPVTGNCKTIAGDNLSGWSVDGVRNVHNCWSPQRYTSGITSMLICEYDDDAAFGHDDDHGDRCMKSVANVTVLRSKEGLSGAYGTRYKQWIKCIRSSTKPCGNDLYRKWWRFTAFAYC